MVNVLKIAFELNVRYFNRTLYAYEEKESGK